MQIYYGGKEIRRVRSFKFEFGVVHNMRSELVSERAYPILEWLDIEAKVHQKSIFQICFGLRCDYGLEFFFLLSFYLLTVLPKFK